MQLCVSHETHNCMNVPISPRPHLSPSLPETHNCMNVPISPQAQDERFSALQLADFPFMVSLSNHKPQMSSNQDTF